MSDVIRKYRIAGPTLPNSSWAASDLPHIAVMEGVVIDGVPPIKSSEAPGGGAGRPLFDSSPQPPIRVMPSEPERKSIFRKDNPKYDREPNTT